MSSISGTKTSDFEILKEIGFGSFAKVHKVRRKKNGEILVWKELEYGQMNDKEKQMLCDEVNILRGLNHPNIVKFIDRIIDHSLHKIYILQEYCCNGDLSMYIKNKKENNKKISESFIWQVLTQISLALKYCHNYNKTNNLIHKILHRDLKPSNIFIIKRNNFYIFKLGDFGLAKMYGINENENSILFAKTLLGYIIS